MTRLLCDRGVLAVIFLILLTSFPALAESAVTLKTTTEVNRPAIRLADVFDGVPEGIDRDIATAPAPGKSVTYDVHVLSKLAEQYRLDWQPQSLSDRAVLTRAATRITQDMILAAVLDKLKEQDIKGKVEAVFDNRALEVDLPADRQPDFALNNFEYDASTKRFRADIRAETGSSPIILPVTGRVNVSRNVPVLAHRLDVGATIAEADLEWMTVPDEHVTVDTVTEAAQVVGHELRHDVTVGQPLRTHDVMPQRLVVRGSIVTMKIETPYMLITAQGRALQDGGAGDVVRVTNTQSNRVVEGVVEASGIVRIPTAQKLAAAE